MDRSDMWNPINWILLAYNVFMDLTLWRGKVGVVYWHPEETGMGKPDGYMVIYTADEGNKEIPFYIGNRLLARRIAKCTDHAIILGVVSEAVLDGMSPRGFRFNAAPMGKEFISPYSNTTIQSEEFWPQPKTKPPVVQKVAQLQLFKSMAI